MAHGQHHEDYVPDLGNNSLRATGSIRPLLPAALKGFNFQDLGYVCDEVFVPARPKAA